MGPHIWVNIEDLAKARTICTMQADHLRAIGAFIAANCQVDQSGGGAGWVLTPFMGIYAQARGDAESGFNAAATAATGLADSVEGSCRDYSSMEASAVQEFQLLCDSLSTGTFDFTRSVGPGAPVDLDSATPAVLAGHDAVLPSWLRGTTDGASALGAHSSWVSPIRKVHDATGELLGWKPEPGTSTPEIVAKYIDEFALDPKNWVKAGTTWIEDQFRSRSARAMGLELDEYKSTVLPLHRQTRYMSSYVGGLLQNAELDPTLPSRTTCDLPIATPENHQTVSRALGGVTETLQLAGGVDGIVDGAVKVDQAVQRNGRVQDVANGSGYGDASLAGMGVPVPAVIQEIENPRPAISEVPLSTIEDIGESLRWKAGFLLGGLDWIISQIIDPGPIEWLVKPLTGDWHRLDITRQCWARAGVAVAAVGHNFEGMPAMLGSWGGVGKESFAASMGDISDTMYDFSDGCYAMSDVTAALIDLGKAAGEFIAGILGRIGDWLTRLAVEAAIPVFGWIAGAIDATATSIQITAKINQGLNFLKKFLDMIDKVLKVIEMLNKIIDVVKFLERTMSALANAGTALQADDAARKAFAITP